MSFSTECGETCDYPLPSMSFEADSRTEEVRSNEVCSRSASSGVGDRMPKKTGQRVKCPLKSQRRPKERC